MDSTSDSLRLQLRRAVDECSSRGLFFAAKWAAEQLCSLTAADSRFGGPATPTTPTLSRAKDREQLHLRNIAAAAAAPAMAGRGGDDSNNNNNKEEEEEEELRQKQRLAAEWDRLDADERDHTALAKSLFDLRELDRAAFCLRECKGPRAVFLRLYAQYLSRERKRKTGDQQLTGEDSTSPTSAAAAAAAGNAQSSIDRELVSIRDELLGLESPDSFCLFLLATVQLALGQREDARGSCIRSVCMYEYNWSAWLLLESCMDPRQHRSVDSLDAELSRCTGWMRHAFMAHVLLELFAATPAAAATSAPASVAAITATSAAAAAVGAAAVPASPRPGGGASAQDFAVHYHVLEQLFPQSMFVIGLRAVRHYNMREFEEAGRLFAQLRQLDPFRLELSDIHSNILFVMEDRARLSELAHRCAEVDRFRPETCCVIGNYYSLRKQHEKAVGYFQRALQLDRNYLAAWTLMGHEFIELKNTAAAIDAYRHAVDVDDRDYRAWYGLGKTYEMLNMPHYACSYYSRAAALRPYDSRMWCALANCYELGGQPAQAVACYRRALAGSSECEALAIGRLAKLYEEKAAAAAAPNGGGPDRERAAYYYQLLYQHAAKNAAGASGAGGPFGDSGLSGASAGAGGIGGGGAAAANATAVEQDELAAACLFLAAFELDRGNAKAAHQYLAQVIEGASQQRADEAKAMMRAHILPPPPATAAAAAAAAKAASGSSSS
ncbi:anaphase-promoting complex component apc8 [Coemansia sp. RSA 2049]|nr:anaphase-promoting complex component apc8 [Coemansia sp. RSA 2049]